mgnify:CR=1 FL=1
MLTSLIHRFQEAAKRVFRENNISAEHAKPADASYRVYTTEFDEVIDGATLFVRADTAPQNQPVKINPYVNVDYDALMRMSANLRTNCRELHAHLVQTLSRDARDDTIVSLLFDHSGSLRGLPALAIAETAEALADALTSAGIATEVLGFTTVRWRGGRSREKWANDGCPPLPGRLNDVLYIVHVDGSIGPVPGPHSFPGMRHDIVFKENIDGEALEWASGRLIANCRSKKILIVVSDGAPVDDSTLNDNWPTILTDHAEQVASQIASSNGVKLGAVGIGYSVGCYYPRSTTAEDLTALATVVPAFVGEMVLDAHR